MTQGVLAGMNNTATTQTVINVTGHWYGLGVVAGNFPRATQLAWCAIQAASLDPGSEAVYAIGRGRGVYAVGLDGEGVVSYSYNAHGVTGTAQSQNTAGVLGQNTEGGIGVLRKADGNAHADGTPASPASAFPAADSIRPSTRQWHVRDGFGLPRSCRNAYRSLRAIAGLDQR